MQPKRKIYTRPSYQPRTYTEQEGAETKLVDFFARRGISKAVVERNRIEVREVWIPAKDRKERALAFPYLRNGEVVNVQYRTADKHFSLEKDAELILYGIDDIEVGQPLLFCEGQIDKLSLEEAGFPNAVSVPNGAKNINGEWIESAKEKLDSASYFILAGDNDEPGKECQIELSRRLGVEKCWRVEWPDGCKDANDVLVKLGVESLQNAVNTATPLPINGVIEISDLWPEIERMYFDGLTGGVDVGWENLSQIYKPRLGEFTVLTGAPNTGKSSMLDAMLVNIALLHQWKMAIYSPEQQPLALHAANLIRIEKGLPFRIGMNERMTLEQAKTSAFRVSEYFKLLSPDEEELTVEGIIRLAKACVTRYGIKGLVIDPWNELEHARPSNQTETEFIAESLRKLRRFARLYQIHLWIIVHPTKQQKDKEGVYPVVTPYDLMGSSHWYNKADMILSLWRDSLLPDAPLTVHSQKVRFQENGRLGEANLYYDSATGRLSDREWNNRQSWENAQQELPAQEELSNGTDMPEF